MFDRYFQRHGRHCTRLVARTLIFVVAAAGLMACSGKGAPGEAGSNTIRIAYVNWADSIAMTNLVTAILEDKMGYQVQTTLADVAPVYTAVANGDEDLFLNAWLPVTHANYWKRYGSQLEDLGPNFKGAKIGLVVPDYAPGDSIADLNKYIDAYGGKIIGIDPGAGIMEKTAQAIKAYGLDYSLVQSSAPAMTAALKQAIDRHKPIVVTGWQPHWMFARWKLHFLKDPKGIYGQSEQIKTVARKGFSKDHPEVAAFLRRFELNSQQLASLMDGIRTGNNPAKAAENWMNAHPKLVSRWVGQAAATNPPSQKSEP